MAEYKDITSIKEQIAHVKRNVKSENGAYLIGYISALSTVEGMIASLPAADIEPVKHGHWEYGEERNGSVYAYCTACRRKMNFNCYGYPHCPLCGARNGR